MWRLCLWLTALGFFRDALRKCHWVGSRSLLDVSLKLQSGGTFLQRPVATAGHCLPKQVTPTPKLKVMHWPASPCEKNCERPQQLQRNKFNKFFSRFLQTLSVCMLDVLSFIKKHNMLFVLLWYACLFLLFFCFFQFFDSIQRHVF